MISWDEGKVAVGSVKFMVTSETIVAIIGLSMEGEKILRNTIMSFKEAFKLFLDVAEKILRSHSSFNREQLSRLWKIVAMIIVKFVTCKGRYKHFHSHIFSTLNHF